MSREFYIHEGYAGVASSEESLEAELYYRGFEPKKCHRVIEYSAYEKVCEELAALRAKTHNMYLRVRDVMDELEKLNGEHKES